MTTRRPHATSTLPLPGTETTDLVAGLAILHQGFLDATDADALLGDMGHVLRWRQETLPMLGGVPMPRLTAFVGDPGVTVRYAGISHDAQPWPPQLQAIRRRLEAFLDIRFDGCLGNLYRHGRDSVDWHSDSVSSVGDVIASLSLGASRPFQLRRSDPDQRISADLHHGDLLVMHAELHTAWQHRAPKRPRIQDQRINLTFRQLR